MAEPFSTSPDDFPGIYADDDRVYEEIEAPKFVDFSAPENFLPYDSSWFCTRIGCDQKHDEIDPDTIYRNFVMRVMAARSPNVLLRKSFRHHVQRCPKTEPVKCLNDHKLRFAEKATNARLKAHPISSLRATTPQAKAKAHQSLDAPKDMATTKSDVRPCKRMALESSKASSSVAKTKRLGSSSIARSPKRAHSSATSATSTTPKSRLCSSMRKHKIETQKEAPKHQLQSSSDCQRDRTHHGNETKVKKSSCIVIDDSATTSESFKKNGDDDNGRNVELGDKAQTSKPESDRRSVGANIRDNGSNSSHSNDQLLSKDPDSMVHSTQEDINISDTSLDREDDKENVQAVHSSRDHLFTNDDDENTCIEQSGRSSFQKATDTTPGKCLIEKSKHVLKCKKMMPTNPKPFRFRTDERGVLKEANLEKRTQQQVPLREIKQAITPLTKKQQLEKNVESAQVVESGSKNAKPPCFHHSSVDSHSNTVNAKSSSANGSKTRRVLSTKEEHSSSSITPSWVRKATTVPKEPNFQKMHVPKNCTKRAVVQAII